MYAVSSSIAEAWARGHGRYRRVLQPASSASWGDYKSSGRVGRAHFDGAGDAYTAVPDCEEGTSTDSASRRVQESCAETCWKMSGGMSWRKRTVVLASPSPFIWLSMAHTCVEDIDQDLTRVIGQVRFAPIETAPRRMRGLKYLLFPNRACCGKSMRWRRSQPRKRPPLQPGSQRLPSPPWLPRQRQTAATRSLHNPVSHAPQSSRPALMSRAQKSREWPFQSRRQRTLRFGKSS